MSHFYSITMFPLGIFDVIEDLVKWYVTFKITTLSMLLSFLHLILQQSFYMYICTYKYISTINNLSCGQTTVKNLLSAVALAPMMMVFLC